MEAFLHLSLGSSLCGESDNLVRSARKITHADKEHHLHIKNKKTKTHRRIVEQVGMSRAKGVQLVRTHTHTRTQTCRSFPGGSNSALEVRRTIWLAFKDPWRSVYLNGSKECHHFRGKALVCFDHTDEDVSVLCLGSWDDEWDHRCYK